MEILKLEHPDFLYGLLLIPVFIAILWFNFFARKKALKRFGQLDLIRRLFPDVSNGKMIFKFTLWTIAYISLIIALANPQQGSKMEEAKRQGIDIIIGLDVSNSMMAEDIKPNRLERAKQAMSSLIDKLREDRIGIVLFAGKAYTQLPITSDFTAAKMYISTINTNLVPSQGTAIAEAINLAAGSFGEDDYSKAVIIITDGEDHEGDAVEAAKNAFEKGINVYTIGMGSVEGSPIPVVNEFGQNTGFKTDQNGSTVVSRLDETLLQRIASAGNGIYVRASTSQVGLQRIYDELNKLEKTEFESKSFSDYEDRFQYFVAFALILLLMEMLFAERKSVLLKKIKIFTR